MKTMKVRMLVHMSGPNVIRNTGDELEIEGKEAQRLIEAGIAEPVRKVKAERAVKGRTGEKAVK